LKDEMDGFDELEDGYDYNVYPGLEISYTDLPSQAIARTSSQLVLLKARLGSIDPHMRESVSYVLTDVERVQDQLADQEWVQLRAIWFSNKSGCYTVHVDLVYDQRNKPSLSAEQILDAFHDGNVPYPDGQMVTVEPYFAKAMTLSDGFFPISDSYYEKVRDAIGWK